MAAARTPRSAPPSVPRTPILRRLDLRRRVTPGPDDPAEDRGLIAASLAYLFLGGATLSLVWLVLPHARSTSELGILIPTFVAYAAGAGLVIGYDRLPLWALKAAVTLATLVITAAVLANDESGSAYTLYYLWATLYAFCFFSLRQAALQTALVGIAYAVVLTVQRATWTEEIARWLITMGTLVAAGMLVHFLAGALRHRALHDPLTGLANRRLLVERLDHALGHPSAADAGLAVLFLDLDRFKLVNDSFGHQVGDELLCAVAPRLASCLRDGDLIARFGGDEFAVLCRGLTRGAPQALEVAERLGHVLRTPLVVGSDELRVSASVGVAIATPGCSSETLVRDADAAMYRAKEAGGGRAAMFDDALRRRVTRRLRLENDLRRALDRNEIAVAFQPIHALRDATVVSMEALARWTHPDLGEVPADEFIPIAEETGMIDEVGRLVLEGACRQAAAWDADGAAYAGLGVSVNLSPREFAQPDLPARVDRVLADAGLASERLTLEITERVLQAHATAPLTTFAALRRLGIRLALDDFGTGYASLAYLQHFPLDQLKLDASLIAGLDRGSREEAIVGAIVGLARALDLGVVAEGVETEAQRVTLMSLGCTMGQGIVFEAPAYAQPRGTARVDATTAT